MRLLLDHCGQGVLTLNPAGQISAERSAAVDRWLGQVPTGTPFSDIKLGGRTLGIA